MLRGPVTKTTMEMRTHFAVCTLFRRYGSGGNRNTLSFFIGKRNEERENGPEFHQSDGAIKYLGYGPFAILALPLGK
jgi:hypothetical protein